MKQLILDLFWCACLYAGGYACVLVVALDSNNHLTVDAVMSCCRLLIRLPHHVMIVAVETIREELKEGAVIFVKSKIH